MSNYDDYFNDRNNNQSHEEHKSSYKPKKDKKDLTKKILKLIPKILIPIVLIIGVIIAGKTIYNFFFNNTVEYLFFEEASSTMRVGTTQDIVPVVISKNGTGFKATLTYTSSNQSIATVDENGVVTAKTIGQTKIKAKDTLSQVEIEMTLNVVADKVNLNSITLEKESLNLYLNQERFLGFSYNPENTTERGITLTSSDPDKVSISGKKIKGESYGSADIKVISPEGTTLKTIHVNVVKDTITSLTIDEPNLMVKKGKKDTIKFSYETSDNSTLVDEEIYLMSNDYLTISGKQVSAKKIGATDAYVKVGKQIKKFTINVIENDKEIKSIKINASNSKVKTGDTIQLTVEYTPSDAEDKGVTWKSSDTSIATVDSSGKVKGVKAGTVIITATAKNGISQTQTITVESRGSSQQSAAFYCSPSTLQIGRASTLTVTSTTHTITGQSPYSNSCTGVATVTSTVVKGIASGICTINMLVQTTNGAYIVSCPMTVY